MNIIHLKRNLTALNNRIQEDFHEQKKIKIINISYDSDYNRHYNKYRKQ